MKYDKGELAYIPEHAIKGKFSHLVGIKDCIVGRLFDDLGSELDNMERVIAEIKELSGILKIPVDPIINEYEEWISEQRVKNSNRV